MKLLPVSHQQQLQQTDCLATCAAMILDYLQVPMDYARLCQLLNVRSFGAVFSDLENLEAVGLSVLVDEGSIETIQQYLDKGLPVVTAVNTSQLLSYWDESTSHTVVIVGIEDDLLYLNDPALPTAPQSVSLAEFELAWLEKDYLYAVIGLVNLAPGSPSYDPD